MAKKKENKENEFYLDLAKETGGRILKGSNSGNYFINTGCLSLNYINSGRFIDGGISSGICEIYGPSQSAKSLLGYALMGGVQRQDGYAILLDCERASNEKFAEYAGHCDPSKVIVQNPDSIEQCQEKIINITKRIRTAKGINVPILFVWDSIGVALCERECRELNLPPGYTKEQYKKIVGGKEQPGERAKAASGFLRKINPFLDEQNATLFVVNQIRSKIGILYGSPEVNAGGGNSLPYYANTRIRSTAQKKIRDTKKNVALGVNLKFVNTKSRSFDPYLETEGVQLYFRKGINPLGGLLSALIAAGRVEMVKAGTYKINEPWAEGKEEATFKANKEENSVDQEVLYAFPQLVDASSADEIREFIGVFADTINLHKSDDVKEESVSVEEEGDGYESEIDAVLSDKPEDI